METSFNINTLFTVIFTWALNSLRLILHTQMWFKIKKIFVNFHQRINRKKFERKIVWPAKMQRTILGKTFLSEVFELYAKSNHIQCEWSTCLIVSLKSYSAEMIPQNERSYSQRRTISLAYKLCASRLMSAVDIDDFCKNNRDYYYSQIWRLYDATKAFLISAGFKSQICFCLTSIIEYYQHLVQSSS